MTDLLRPVEGVVVDVDRFMEIVHSERNLAPAFGKALEVDQELFERLYLEDELTPEQEKWYGMDLYQVDCEWPCPVFEIFGALGATDPESLLSFVWTSFGPISWSRSSCLTRGLLGYDVAFSLDEAEGYPVLLLQKTGQPGFEQAAAAALCAELAASESFGLPSLIENHVPGLIPKSDVAAAVHRRLEADDAWVALRALIIDEALYEGPVEMSRARLRSALSRIDPESGELLPDPEEGKAVPIVQEDKQRLLASYMERHYSEMK